MIFSLHSIREYREKVFYKWYHSSSQQSVIRVKIRQKNKPYGLVFSVWRRDRDSNPGYLLQYAAFPRRCTRPLCDLSFPIHFFLLSPFLPFFPSSFIPHSSFFIPHSPLSINPTTQTGYFQGRDPCPAPTIFTVPCAL